MDLSGGRDEGRLSSLRGGGDGRSGGDGSGSGSIRSSLVGRALSSDLRREGKKQRTISL